jgi:hypothetical protein
VEAAGEGGRAPGSLEDYSAATSMTVGRRGAAGCAVLGVDKKKMMTDKVVMDISVG